jgi:hypothetical protein
LLFKIIACGLSIASKHPSEIEFSFKDLVKGFRSLPIELDRLALLARHLPRVTTVCIDLQDDATVALKSRVRCLNLVV